MARKKNHEELHEEHADETWLIPYSDLLTLLLALFIVLFASSSLDKAKQAAMEQAFMEAFNGLPPDQMGGTLISFMKDAKGLDLSDQIGLGSDSQGAVFDLADAALFDPGSDKLSAKAVPALRSIAGLLKSDRYARFRVEVEGHTDDNETSPQYASRRALSAARASTVTDVLVRAGVDEARIKTVGMADISPAYANLNAYGEPIPENRRRNRRVIIRVVP